MGNTTHTELKGKCIVCGEEAKYYAYRKYTGKHNWWWMCKWHAEQTAKYPNSIPSSIRNKTSAHSETP